MTTAISFTKQAIQNLPVTHKRVYYRDTNPRSPKGFGLYTTPAGAKCFYLARTVEGKTKMLPVGRFPDLPLEKARKEAEKLAGVVASGVNPIKAKKASRAQEITLEAAFQDYLESRGGNLAASTRSNYSTVINTHLASFKTKPLKEISRDMVESKHRQLSKKSPTAANTSMRVLRAIFNYANGRYEDSQGQPLFPDNPVSRLSHVRAWNRETRRTSVLKPSDMPAWHEAVQSLSNYPYGETIRDYLLVILYTGLRRREAAHLTWDSVDFNNNTIHIIDTKNKQPLLLPLSKPVREILHRRRLDAESEWVFPGRVPSRPIVEPKKQIQRVRALSEVYFTLHDLRRTFITVAESLDISAYAIKHLVNHASGGDVTHGYIVMDVERLRPPMEKIGEKISELTGRVGK